MGIAGDIFVNHFAAADCDKLAESGATSVAEPADGDVSLRHNYRLDVCPARAETVRLQKRFAAGYLQYHRVVFALCDVAANPVGE